ncbi:hypothetical protein NDU88_004591 [Pleurodeles waltl]|uniref:Uncharacterized protein n=1 Tax=Pleurodeles waltl TaxID=8319 RepID=A0AAV7PI02_PLEWA|nr:hypothetical protein NDU88_004591 [Pleurodeles waltl]
MFPATVQAPGSHQQYPGGTNQSDGHPEENPNPDIRVKSASQEPEKERTEAEEERDASEQSEERSKERSEPSEKESDKSEERSEEIVGKTQTQTRLLDERSSHVPGGAWLSQGHPKPSGPEPSLVFPPDHSDSPDVLRKEDL